MSKYAAERIIGIQAVLKASKLCQNVFTSLVKGTITKTDASPVTVADFGAQAVVNFMLSKSFPNDKFVGEEDSIELQNTPELLAKVVELSNNALELELSADQITAAIDLGSYAGGETGRFWTLDPIDGTKGFLRGGQYAVCLALIEDGEVQLAIQGCPNLPVSNDSSNLGCLFIATRGEGAFQRSFDSQEEKRIKVSQAKHTTEMKFCESVESGHSSHSNSATIAAALGITKEPVRMDSQCKYAIVSRGDADIYLRLPVSMSYEEKIWDHAGGSLLITEAGGKICDIYGKKLNFGQGRTLKSKGIVASNGVEHDKIIAAVQQTLQL